MTEKCLDVKQMTQDLATIMEHDAPDGLMKDIVSAQLGLADALPDWYVEGAESFYSNFLGNLAPSMCGMDEALAQEAAALTR